jgi:hypothetical protein
MGGGFDLFTYTNLFFQHGTSRSRPSFDYPILVLVLYLYIMLSLFLALNRYLCFSWSEDLYHCEPFRAASQVSVERRYCYHTLYENNDDLLKSDSVHSGLRRLGQTLSRLSSILVAQDRRIRLFPFTIPCRDYFFAVSIWHAVLR